MIAVIMIMHRSCSALASLKKIKAMMATAVSTNESTKAHRGNIVFMIDRALDAD